MAADIVPELYEKIQKDFQRNTDRHKGIREFREKLKKETASAEDVSVYAGDLGECVSDALCGNLTEETLPDGMLYWNIAERTIKPLLKEVYKMVNEAAAAVQKTEDKKIGIGLGSVKAPFPESRVKDLINKLISILEKGNE